MHLADRSVRAVSGGELQRVIIARALAQEPRLLLLDEPTAHLDLGQQMSILRTMKQMSQEITVIGVFHDLNYASHFCDRLILLSDHRVLAMGEPAEVLTTGTIRTAFGTDVTIRKNPFTGRPFITLLYDQATGINRPGKVHVICGAGEGSELLRALHAGGYLLTTGVLSINDSDYITARDLGIDCISEPPFSPISDRSLGELRLVLEATGVVIVAGGLWGPGNIGNLQVLESAGNRPVILLERPEGADREWDFTGGEAAAILDRLAVNGAVSVHDIRSVIPVLDALTGGESCPK
jgi:iron complex transport system ATP-binding protein